MKPAKWYPNPWYPLRTGTGVPPLALTDVSLRQVGVVTGVAVPPGTCLVPTVGTGRRPA